MFHKSLMTLIIFGLGICMIVLGCKVSEPNDFYKIEELLSAPEQVEIYGRDFVMKTYLWRDFMPISPPDGKPLVALVWIIATDSLEFPSSIDADRLWVIKDRKEVWETEFSNEKVPQEHKHQLAKIARNGPKWGPHIYVDVVVRIIDKENNIEYLLKASNQWIHLTM